ncbi:potassium channel family protein [Ruania halotolerans]|uniref:potassium channel family protein n=1 Tax=Ruania halotolerans TaxID=2897773 RepID=UPI001E5A7700|nr:potassium channel family protein [Ruania halotolerans]UFU07444.1 potassium channel family protein [Ruania halotolerans]
MSFAPPANTRRRTRTLGTLLTLIVVLQFGYPISGLGPAWTAVYMAAYAAMLGFGIVTVRDESGRLIPMVAATVVFLVCGTWFSFAQHSVHATVAMLTSVALSMAVLIYALLRFVFRRERAPGVNLVLASVSAYLVMGGFFGATFALLEIASPGSFMDPQGDGGPLGWHQTLYYSYVTLATLGYGDVLPVTTWARSLGSFVAVIGTLYLTVVVARLVGIWSSKATDTN